MTTIVLASQNKHKISEAKEILGSGYEILSLSDIGCNEDIPETGSSFKENALQKALYVKQHYGYDCIADDSGLECEALNGEPGIFSARYADINGSHNAQANMDKLLNKLKDKANRKACFKTIIAYVHGNDIDYFEGIVCGTILKERKGSEGFGYDPIFQPLGYEQSFAQMSSEQKNAISHRSRALNELVKFLNK